MADFIHYEYQCVPGFPTGNVKLYSCEDVSIDNVEHGFIQSPKYPLYPLGVNCELKVTPPVNYGIKFYLIDLAMISEE